MIKKLHELIDEVKAYVSSACKKISSSYFPQTFITQC